MTEHKILSGKDIERILEEKGNVVQAVLLRCGEQTTKDRLADKSYFKKDSLLTPLVVIDSHEHAEIPENFQQEEKKDDSTVSQHTFSESLDNLEGCELEHLVEQIEIDTTPKERAVARLLTGSDSGQITFLGQYEDEGIVVIAAKDYSETAKLNPHTMPPPLHKLPPVRGDILLVRVRPNDDLEEEEEAPDDYSDSDAEDESEALADQNDLQSSSICIAHITLPVCPAQVMTDALASSGLSDGQLAESDENKENDVVFSSAQTHGSNNPTVAVEGSVQDDQPRVEATFFQDYTKAEYLTFIKRTDYSEEHDPLKCEDDADEQDDGDYDPEDDSDNLLEEESPMAMFHMVLGHLMRQFQELNGRGPGSMELLRMRALLAERMGVELEGAAAIVLSEEENDDDDIVKDATPHQVRSSKKRQREQDIHEDLADDTTNPAKKRYKKRIQWKENLTHVQEIPAYSASSDDEDPAHIKAQHATDTDDDDDDEFELQLDEQEV